MLSIISLAFEVRSAIDTGCRTSGCPSNTQFTNYKGFSYHHMCLFHPFFKYYFCYISIFQIWKFCFWIYVFFIIFGIKAKQSKKCAFFFLFLPFLYEFRNWKCIFAPFCALFAFFGFLPFLHAFWSRACKKGIWPISYGPYGVYLFSQSLVIDHKNGLKF